MLLTILAILLLAGTTRAQQRMQYSQYLLNGYFSNPAVAGMEDHSDLKAGFSSQWVGFDGAPQGFYLSFYTPVIKKISAPEQSNPLPVRGRTAEDIAAMQQDSTVAPPQKPKNPLRTGLGFSFYSESAGPIRNSGLTVSYALHFPITEKLKIAFGATLGLLNFRLDPASIFTLDPNDQAINTSLTSLFLPTVNAGGILYSRKFFIGMSSRQLLQNRLLLDDQNNSKLAKLALHYLINAGYRAQLTDDISLLPSFMFRFVSPAPPSVDLNLRIDYKDVFFAGITYRHTDAIIAMAGVRIANQLQISYAYDYTISNLGNYSSGTHGIAAGFRFAKRGNSLEQQYFW